MLATLAASQLAGAELAQLPDPAHLPALESLPNPLLTTDGTQIDSPALWKNERRPELKRLFQHYVYGYMPEPPGIVVREELPPAEILEGKAILKQIEISFQNLPEEAPKIHLALFLPKAKTPAPVFLALNKCGNQTVLADEALRETSAWTHDDCDRTRGKDTAFWSVAYFIERGYGFATFHESDIDPDKHDFTDGIHPYYPELAGPSGWGTIAAWAWGLHRCIDYLGSDPDVDKARICLTGHSRRGKTALFAAAMDERAALVVPLQSGTGGMALSRDNNQETVERINRVFPHWFCDTFTAFNDRENLLPVDQHLLIALIAPRPLLDIAGLQDKWANYESALMALRAANPVYQLLKTPGLVGEGVVVAPDRITAGNAGTLLQYRRDTKHMIDQGYWEAILDFADLRLSH
ncbi:MAG: acetylxylan esterase [Candidatus Hydrogenedentes bacterium]|nr:acetylxylan esterase [Candidatus Hydrogenedentota bacterium]